MLGSGAFGEVWLVRHKDLDREFAMKIIKKRKNRSNDEKEILNEIEILKKLDQKSKGIKTLKKNNKKPSKKSSKKTNDNDESLDISNIRKSLKDKKLSLSNELDDSFLKELYEDNIKKSTTKNKKKNKGKKENDLKEDDRVLLRTCLLPDTAFNEIIKFCLI